MGKGGEEGGGMEGGASTIQRPRPLSSDDSYNVGVANASCNVTHDCGHRLLSLPFAVLKP